MRGQHRRAQVVRPRGRGAEKRRHGLPSEKTSAGSGHDSRHSDGQDTHRRSRPASRCRAMRARTLARSPSLARRSCARRRTVRDPAAARPQDPAARRAARGGGLGRSFWSDSRGICAHEPCAHVGAPAHGTGSRSGSGSRSGTSTQAASMRAPRSDPSDSPNLRRSKFLHRRVDRRGPRSSPC